MTITPKIYEIIDLNSARDFFNNHQEPTIITNPRGSTRYYGMLVLDYIFKKLSREFPQIIQVIVDVDDDHAALFTAIKLNYQHINYRGNSPAAKGMLKRLKE